MFEQLINKIRDKRKIKIENLYLVKLGIVGTKAGTEKTAFVPSNEYSFAELQYDKDNYPKFTDVFYPRQYSLYNQVWTKRGIRCCIRPKSFIKWLQESESSLTKEILINEWIYYDDLKYICDKLNEMQKTRKEKSSNECEKNKQLQNMII